MVKQTLTTIVLCLGAFLITGIQQTNADDLSSNIFNFQKKLANSGNVQSQTKLGEMLEAGTGVEKNIDQARHWYLQAANSGYEPAKNRLVYMDIRASGYNKAKHSDWVTTIKAQARDKNRDSMLLLAQMYREGLGIEKNLAAAKEILETLSISGNMSIDNETVLLDAAIRGNQKHEQELAAQRARQRAEAERQQNAQAKEKAQQQAARSRAAAAKQETVEEKRKRYEEVMRKLAEEQRILKEQQSWAEERN